MTQRNIGRGVMLLGLVILATVIQYAHSPRTMLAGGSYLAAATIIGFICLLGISTVKIRLKKESSASLWLLVARAQVTLFAAWQFAILGILNIWAFNFVGSAKIFVLSNVLLLICVFISDRLIALADSPDQDGGSKPLSSLGRPRSRRLFFWAFFVYPASSLVIAEMILSERMKPYPAAFLPPQLCLLLDAVSSAVTAGLVFQRYRGKASGQPLAGRFILAVLLILGFGTGLQYFIGLDMYPNVLCSFTVVCTAVSAYYLWRPNISSSLPDFWDARGTPPEAGTSLYIAPSDR
jgi:hypothetical protein